MENCTNLYNKEPGNYVFISYSSKNIEFATAFNNLLNKNGIKTWIAPRDIPLGVNSFQYIPLMLKSSRCVALLISKESRESPWVRNGLEAAINERKPLIPIIIDGGELDLSFQFYLSGKKLYELSAPDENSEQFRIILEEIKKLNH